MNTAKQYKSLKESQKDKNIFEIKEVVSLNEGTLVLSEGDIIKILRESLDWDDIVDLAKKEKLDPKVIAFVNFIDKHQDKYKAGIKDFVDWWNDEMDVSDLDAIERLIAKNPPDETGFEGLPSNDWKFYTGKATESTLKEDYTFYIDKEGGQYRGEFEDPDSGKKISKTGSLEDLKAFAKKNELKVVIAESKFKEDFEMVNKEYTKERIEKEGHKNPSEQDITNVQYAINRSIDKAEGKSIKEIITDYYK